MSTRLEMLKNLLENDKNDSFLNYAIAKEYESSDLYDDALSYYNFIKTNDPNYVGMYYHLGRLYEKMDQSEKAIESYNLGIEIAKKIPDFHALSELNTAKLNLEMEM